jgi:hypothetical protein
VSRAALSGAATRWLAVLGCVAAAACAQAVPPAGGEAADERLEVAPGEPFPLALGQTARVRPGGLELTFQAVVSDSRCPVDVTCVWAGEARLRLKVSGTGAPPEELELSTLEGEPARLGGFGIEVLGLDPVPRSGVELDPATYELRLVVSETG